MAKYNIQYVMDTLIEKHGLSAVQEATILMCASIHGDIPNLVGSTSEDLLSNLGLFPEESSDGSSYDMPSIAMRALKDMESLIVDKA